ncbi:MAG: FmdB family zinc ribbon protein [Pyrinomonadaceae bacterium]
MPIYEYQCKQCGSHFEKRRSISDEPMKTCEKCGGELEKQWSLSGFQLKGEGWYVTDYAGKKGPATEPAAPGNKPAGEGKEKSSAGESTGASDSASKPVSETKPAPVAKKDGGSEKSN